MKKTFLRTTLIIGKSKNFSEYTDGQFDVNDDGKQEERMYSDTNADMILVDLLGKLNDREKIVFLYELLRQSGYGLNGEECAKTLSMSRQWYSKLLKDVRKKAQKTLQNSSA